MYFLLTFLNFSWPGHVIKVIDKYFTLITCVKSVQKIFLKIPDRTFYFSNVFNKIQHFSSLPCRLFRLPTSNHIFSYRYFLYFVLEVLGNFPTLNNNYMVYLYLIKFIKFRWKKVYFFSGTEILSGLRYVLVPDFVDPVFYKKKNV